MGILRKPRSSSQLRNAALVLFGLATVAALIGLVLAVNRSVRSEPIPTATVPVSASPAPTSAARPSVIPFPPPVVSAPAETPAGSPAGSPAAPPEAVSAGEKNGNQGEVRVYNNSTIRGLAARAARDLAAGGWTVVEVGNFARGTIPTTTVYYQDGTDQRAIAEAIAAKFGMRAEPRFPGISALGPGVIVIVTNDYSH